MKQEERRQQTVQLLLQTVAGLIEEKGCDRITMNDMIERSGLSKGAIFHYVKTKDEIFALILRERLEAIDSRFVGKAERPNPGFEGPLREITKSLPALEDSRDITNQILMYLLGRSGQPAVEEALGSFYAHSLRLSRQWIVDGQRHGVIPESIDADQTAELFVLISCGLRMRAAMFGSPSAFDADRFAAFIADTLNPRPHD